MPDPKLANIPVHVPMVREPMGVWASLQAARRNLLRILPWLAVKQPMMSGRTGIRWHMVMDPGAIRRVLLEKLDDYPKSNTTKSPCVQRLGKACSSPKGRTGAGIGAPRLRCLRIATY